MIIRTASENKAYIDGYNACFDAFTEYLQSKKTRQEIIEKMTLIRTAVNSASLFYGQEQKRGDKNGTAKL